MARQTTQYKEFDQGMSPDIRKPGGFARIHHFKVEKHRLVPEFSTEADENKSYGIIKFAFGPWLASGVNTLFGLGKVPSGSRPAIYIKDFSGDIVGGSWGTPTDNEALSDGAKDDRVFFHYKGYLHGFSGGNKMWRFGKLDDTNAKAFTESYQDVSYTNVAQPVHHPNDDCAYFFADNTVIRLNGSSYEGVVLTLPDNLIITSGEPVGNYLAIACKQKSRVGGSTVFLWDRDSSLSTLSGRIDFGEGDLEHIAYLDGALIGVTNFFTNSDFGHYRGKVIIKQAVNDKAIALAEFEYDQVDAATFTGNKMVIDNKLHFPLRMRRNGGTWEGIAAVDSRGRLTFPFSEEEVTDNRIQGFTRIGNYWFIAHSLDGSVNRTNDQNTYSYKSILETCRIGDPSYQSHFEGATVRFEPLPSGASVSLYYRKDGATSWTLFKTVNTQGKTELSAIKDTNNAVPRFYEIEYRIESLGGAVITGFEHTHQTSDQKPYGRS